jgi:hypothetical protein
MLIAFCSQMAMAATITQFDRATFQTAVSGGTISEQDFDGFLAGTTLTTDGVVTYAASLGTPLVTSTFLTTTPPNGLGSTSVGFFIPSETATFTFGSAISAFGIDINTFDPNEGGYTGTLNIGDTVLSKFDVFPGTATGQFLGFISDTPFTSVNIRTTGGGLTPFSFTLDTLVYGQAQAIIDVGDPNAPIPEPGTLLLFGSALAAEGIRRRFKKRG